jgi:ABC-2 type transport system permease protein
VTVQVLINGDNANTATTVMGYVMGIVGAASARYEVQARLASPAGSLLTLEPRVWYNPELRSALFLVPGLIGYIAMLTAVVSTALSVVREKEAGTMEQIRMSPIGPVAYVLGKTTPYFVRAQSGIIVFVSMLLFDRRCADRGLYQLGVALSVWALAQAADLQSPCSRSRSMALLTSFHPR